MIYIFRTPFITSKGRKIPAGDAVFVDNPEATDEIAVEVMKRIAEETKEPTPKKKNTKI